VNTDEEEEEETEEEEAEETSLVEESRSVVARCPVVGTRRR